jgi:hypothetical protein
MLSYLLRCFDRQALDWLVHFWSDWLDYEYMRPRAILMKIILGLLKIEAVSLIAMDKDSDRSSPIFAFGGWSRALH